MIECKTGLLTFKETDKPFLGGSLADDTLCIQAHLNEFVVQVKATKVEGRTYDTSTELLVMHESEPGVVARLFLLDTPYTIVAAQAVAEELTGAEERENKIKFEEPFKVYSVEYEDYLVVRDSVGLKGSGGGCKITAYPDGTARIFVYDARRRGPLPLEGYVQNVPMGRRVLESLWKDVTA